MNQTIKKIKNGLLEENDFFLLKNCSISDYEDFVLTLKLENLKVTSSTDGLYSIVKGASKQTIDFSQNTNFFASHIDGFYKEKIPKYVILYCIDKGEKSIPSFFINTEKLFNSLALPVKDCLDKLNIVYIHRDLKEYKRTFVERKNGKIYLNLANRAYFLPKIENLELSQIPSFEEILFSLNTFYMELTKSDIKYHYWEKGDLIVFNNRNHIHGRGKFELQDKGITDNKRTLLRIWIENLS